MSVQTRVSAGHSLGDFTATPRLLQLALMAVVVGSFGAFSAWVLLRLIALITNIAYLGRLSVAPAAIPAHLSPWTIAIPVIGSLIVGLMARYGSEKIRGHGIPEAIEAILIGRSRIQPKVALLKPLSSAISIGTGGPFGAEGPIIMTGGALGSLFAQLFHMSAAERKTLLVAGAAAGMTAVFGTPIAAVLLAVELLLFEWKPRSFIPVTVASIIAFVWRPFLIAAGPLFPYAGAPAMPWWGLGLCVGAGLVAGAQSAVLTLLLYWVEDLFRKLPIHWMWWPALGGLVVGIGGVIDPAVLGVGYDNIRLLLAGGLSFSAAALLLGDKAIVWIVALSSGTSGGVLAPLLIIGGALGALEAHIMPFGDTGFWALLGMAAILGGTMRAPLTAILFAVELTGNLHLLPQLLCASSAGFVFTVLVMPRSILTERIARRGLHLTREYGVDPFEVMRVGEIMATPAESLPAAMTVEQAVAFFGSGERHKSYPVVTPDGSLVGLISRGNVLRWTRGAANQDDSLGDLCTEVATAFPEETAGMLADRMADGRFSRVPVIASDSRKLIGIVSRRELLRVRALALRAEHEREGAVPLPG
ncbi:MAG TPA: chloride channel protein [Rhizomicrobium sp.]|jgi:H+/Cl- antiporter ClcA|nr:chloride channel protein [Rhizomicrobium sp.]